jgi:UbiD family decarboxylase
MAGGARGYRDLQEHLRELDAAGLLWTIDEPINKDSEMHPLVRWQFRGGIAEAERRAFLFTNVVDGKGRKYDMPVAVGALAASDRIYSVGMGVAIDKIGQKWTEAVAKPVPPRIVNTAPCQEVVIEGKDLQADGLCAIPIPLSTPGFDSAPTLTATNVITKDPQTGVQNMGTYRCAFKSPDRLVVRMATRIGGAGGFAHWKEYKKRGEKMPVAIVLGCPPSVAFMGPQKMPIGMDEIEIAGGLVGEPINIVPAKTVPLYVPAESEIVIEGIIDPELLEPEGPFGESHGHVALEEFNMPMKVTAITRKAKPVVASYISQVTPSESSVIKRVAYEPLYLNFMRNTLGCRGVKKVTLHEPLTSLLRIIMLTVEKGTPRTEIWRALQGAITFRADTGKIVIALNDDIDTRNADAVLWALAYRHNPTKDVMIVPHRSLGHGPWREDGNKEDGAILIDATMKFEMPPLALPTKPYMDKARELWEKLGLPALRPESPWHGYALGDWHPSWEEAAQRAAKSDWLTNGKLTQQRQRTTGTIAPETSVREVEDWDD